MKLAITGAAGQLGSALALEANARSIPTVCFTRRELDICDRDQIHQAVAHADPDVVVNAAGSVAVKACEQDSREAWALDVEGVRNLALACKYRGARFVTVSTDYVFGADAGRRRPYVEDDCPGPIQSYGIVKVAGEYAARAAHPDGTFVIRTSGLYGGSGSRSKGGNFVLDRIRDLRTRPTLSVSVEQVSSPSYARHVATGMLNLIEASSTPAGIYHVVNEGAASWYEFTLAIRDALGLTTTVEPVDREGIDGQMRRPLYSALANNRMEELGLPRLPHWRRGLDDYLLEQHLV
ncbi:MAG: dTDP-4-dehydrorhamnose reductase [Chloroflexota bacterium]